MYNNRGMKMGPFFRFKIFEPRPQENEHKD